MALVVDNKRKPDDVGSEIVAKRPRTDLIGLPPVCKMLLIYAYCVKGVSRTSSLLAPTMLLSGHKVRTRPLYTINKI